MAAPHVTGAVALLLQLHPELDAAAGQVGADDDRRARPGRTRRARREAPVTLEGAGLVDVPAADDPQLFTEPGSLSFGDLNAHGGAAAKALRSRSRTRAAAPAPGRSRCAPQAATAGASLDVAGAVALAPGGETFLPSSRAPPRARRRARTTASSCSAAAT